MDKDMINVDDMSLEELRHEIEQVFGEDPDKLLGDKGPAKTFRAAAHLADSLHTLTDEYCEKNGLNNMAVNLALHGYLHGTTTTLVQYMNQAQPDAYEAGIGVYKGAIEFGKMHAVIRRWLIENDMWENSREG